MAQKEKEKATAARGLEIGPQVGPLPHGPRGRCACALLSARSLTSGSRSSGPPSPLSLRDADGVAPPVSSAFFVCGGSAAIPAAAGEVQAHTRVRISSASTLRLHSYCSRTLYRSLSTSTAYMADGRVGCPKTGHEGSVERN